MKRLVCAFMALIILLSLCACDGSSLVSGDENLRKGFARSEDVPVYDYLSQEHTIPEDYEKYTQGAINFGVGLLGESATEDENTAVSPVSVSEVLSVLANGASGKTSNEIRNAIADGAGVDLINTGAHYLNSRLTAFNSEEGYFKSANSLWFDDSFDVKSSFLQTSVNYYDAGLFRIDFTQDKAVDKINGWVSENTDGEIENVIQEIEEDSVSFAINTALLNDGWATPYVTTQKQTFHGAKGDTQAEFMISQEYYLSTSYAEGFVKGFKTLPCKFAAILPKDNQDITEFAKGFTGNRFCALLESQSPMETCLATIPSFSVNAHIELSDSLKAMGINTMFDMNRADFSNLSNTGQVYVGQITQDVFIEIGPLGARAGAVSVADLKYGSSEAPDLPEKRLDFDRPFVFAIFDNESNIPVFMGIVNNVG